MFVVNFLVRLDCPLILGVVRPSEAGDATTKYRTKLVYGCLLGHYTLAVPLLQFSNRDHRFFKVSGYSSLSQASLILHMTALLEAISSIVLLYFGQAFNHSIKYVYFSLKIFIRIFMVH